MSHFAVLIIGDDMEGQLAPYDENTEVEPYKKPCYCVHDGKRCYDCEECDVNGLYTTTYNPKSKWDWYLIGGRFRGYFKLKNKVAAEVVLGPPGTFDNEPFLDADQAKKGGRYTPLSLWY